MSTWQMLRAADWLWPFLLLGMALAGLLAASLVWASGAPAARPAAARANEADVMDAANAADAADTAHAGSRPRSGGRLPAWLITLAAPLLVVALYAALGNPRAINPLARQPVPDEAAETMVSQLAARLQVEPGNLQGWLMLARSYKVLGRYAESADAWEHAKDLVWNDADSLAEWTEARILAHGQRFDRRSQELLARAMSLAPEHPGVLLLRGLAALDRGDAAAAQKAFTTLRDQYPDASPDRNALDAALAQITAGQDPRPQRPAASESQAPKTPLAPNQSVVPAIQKEATVAPEKTPAQVSAPMPAEASAQPPPQPPAHPPRPAPP
ncbi:MAG: hypothetical protein Q4F13_08455 [Pseudomonadota bacterium]|nr:hypothetical protein [Pseudomonadota bacterium]